METFGEHRSMQRGYNGPLIFQSHTHTHTHTHPTHTKKNILCTEVRIYIQLSCPSANAARLIREQNRTYID